MNGFVEELSGRTFIVRLGPDAHEYGDAYEHVCVFNVPNGDNIGEFLAYTSKPPTLEAVRLARKLLGAFGFLISWTRVKDSPYLMRETQGLNGEFRMGKRRMPHADDAKTNGKFDKHKFNAALPDAAAALSSGETKVHKVVIQADDNGKLTIEINRSHGNRKGGMDPTIAVALQKVMVDAINAGTIKVGDMSEAAAVSDQDVLMIKGS